MALETVKLMHYNKRIRKIADFNEFDQYAAECMKLLNRKFVEDKGIPLDYQFFYLQYEVKGRKMRIEVSTESKDFIDEELALFEHLIDPEYRPNNPPNKQRRLGD